MCKLLTQLFGTVLGNIGFVSNKIENVVVALSVPIMNRIVFHISNVLPEFQNIKVKKPNR